MRTVGRNRSSLAAALRTLGVAEGGVLMVRDRTYTDIDTEHGAFPYEEDEPFEVIAREALAAGIGHRGDLGHVFGAAALTAFAVSWMERRFA